jgi:hypothetical protein
VIQQGQVFKLKTKGADGQPLWAYRYRLEGRGRRGYRSADSRAEQMRRRHFATRAEIAGGSGSWRQIPA